MSSSPIPASPSVAPAPWYCGSCPSLPHGFRLKSLGTIGVKGRNHMFFSKRKTRRKLKLWVPVKILYIWVVAIVMVIAFGGAYRFPGFCGNQHIRDPTWSQNPFLNSSEMDRSVVLLVSGGSATLHVPFMLHSFACMFRNFPFICMHLPFIVHSFPFISFHWYSFPFMFLSYSFHVHSNAFMSSHLPFMCTHVPFILHSCPFISFLKLWRWLSGLAREPSAANGYR